MPNQKLLAEYCIPNLLANVQPIHHAWPNKIQTMDCLLLKKKYWVNLRISMTTISQNSPKNLWTSMDQNHGHMPILYKMVCKKVQLYKVAWSRHFWQPHPLYKLAGPCPSSIKLFARTSKKNIFESKQSIVWILLGHAWWIGWTFANRLGIQYSAKSFWFGMCLWFIYIYIDVWIIGIHMFQNTSTTYSIYQSSPIYMTHWKQ